MKKLFVTLSLTVSIIYGFAFNLPNSMTCPAPQNVTKTFSIGGNISYDWDDCSGGCTEYGVSYYRLEDNYSSAVFRANVSAISFVGLPAGTYDFSFHTVCGGQISSFIIIEENIVN